MSPRLDSPTKEGGLENPVIDMGAIARSMKLAGIALCLTFPLCGLRLEGRSYSFHPLVPLSIAGVVLIVALASIAAARTAIGHALLERIDTSRRPAHAEVTSGDLSGRQKMLIAILLIAAALVPLVAGSYVITELILVMIYILLGLGLSIVVGLAGLLDLGYVAFYAIGAYTMALGSHYLGMTLWTAIPVAAVLAGLCGGVLAFPVLRVHGDYLAIVTLGFGEIIRLILNNWTWATGGPNGMEVPAPKFFGLSFTRRSASGSTFHEFFHLPFSTTQKFAFLYLVLICVVCFVVFIVRRLRVMPVGRAWEALREDQIACGSLGLNHVTIKLSAFIVGASLGGVAGVFFASYQGFVSPSSFVFVESALILAIVVLGGMGSIVGVICSALFLTLLPEFLRGAAEYRLFVLGVIMVTLMIWRPRGFVRVKRRAYHDPEPQP